MNHFRLLVLLFACFAQQLAAQPKAEMSLENFEPGNGNTLTLDAPWEFFAFQLLNPSDFQPPHDPMYDTLVVPSSWNDLRTGRKKMGSYGYATYRLTLTHLPHQQLMLNLYSVQTACRVFINGKLAAQVGKVGTSAATTTPANKDIQLVLSAGGSAEIIVQVANFHHRKGGFVHLPQVGTPEDILHRQLLLYVLDATESSALAIMGFFLLALFIFRRKDISVLYFALFCITLSFRPVISVNYLMATLWPGMNWSIMLKLEYLGVVFPCLFMTLFIKKRFTAQLPNLIVKILLTIFTIQILIILFCPPSVFSWLVLPILVLVPTGIVILTITIIRAVIAKVDGANYAGMGVIVLFVSLLLKVLSYAGIIPTMHVLITLLDIGFIFMMSLILGSRFSVQFVKVEALQKKTEQQHQEIQLQKEMVEEKNKEILDSINYAKRIQYALLAHDELLKENLPEHFILFQPKDIVSGDFYWATLRQDRETSNTFYLAVCDSTGHGVPGAFMSLLNISFLNEAINEKNIADPADVFGHIRHRLIENISQEGQKDGMDGILVKFERTSITYAAANNHPVLIRNKNGMELPCDKMPIGKGENDKSFETQTIQSQKGDMLYLYTDGFADQFGGNKGKKFKYSQLNQLLAQVSDLQVEQQKQRLNNAFQSWKGDLGQVDDVCVIGIRL